MGPKHVRNKGGHEGEQTSTVAGEEERASSVENGVEWVRGISPLAARIVLTLFGNASWSLGVQLTGHRWSLRDAPADVH